MANKTGWSGDERKTSIELDIPDTAEERANRELCSNLRAIHREIMVEFDKIDKSQEWVYALKGVTVRYKPSLKALN